MFKWVHGHSMTLSLFFNYKTHNFTQICDAAVVVVSSRRHCWCSASSRTDGGSDGENKAALCSSSSGSSEGDRRRCSPLQLYSDWRLSGLRLRDDHRQIQTTSHDHVEDKHILAAGGHSPGWGARLRAAQLNMLWMGESVVGLQPTVLLSEPLDFLHQRLVHWVFLDQTVDLILKHVGHKMDVQSTLS